MEQAQKIDHYHRCISILDSEDMSIFVVPTKLLHEASMDIGDQYIVESRANALIIKILK